MPEITTKDSKVAKKPSKTPKKDQPKSPIQETISLRIEPRNVISREYVS